MTPTAPTADECAPSCGPAVSTTTRPSSAKGTPRRFGRFPTPGGASVYSSKPRRDGRGAGDGPTEAGGGPEHQLEPAYAPPSFRDTGDATPCQRTPSRRPEPSARGRARALTPCARTSRARTRRVPTPRTRHAPPTSSTPPRLFAPARKRGSLTLCRDPDVVATQDTVSPDILTVCSTPSRRVALLRPRVAGLTALTASPRPRHHDPSLDRRCSRRHPQLLWSTSCAEFRVLK